MSILSRLRERRDRRNYERAVLWRQRNTPYGSMLGQTLAYRRRVESLNEEVAEERKAALDLMKKQVRAAFLSHPAATEMDFERCWPVLRDEIFKEYALRHLAVERPASFFQPNGNGYRH